jgi:hypothetical protein
MDIPLGPYTIGIDNVSGEGELAPGAVADAVNVDFGRAGGVSRRAGSTRRMETTSAHSLWTAPDGRSFGVIDGELCRLTWDGSALAATELRELESDARLSYDAVNASIVCGNASELLEVLADDTVRPLALPRPGVPAAEASAAGGLHAGRYAVALSFLRGGEEGPLSFAAFVDVAEGGGLSVTTPTVDGATAVRVYRSEANGETLQRAADMPLDGTFLVGTGPLGRLADTQYLERLPGGQIVRHWKGLLLVARGHTVMWSEPMRYGLYDPRHNFVQFPQNVILMEPVEGGVFVGTRDGVVFLAGTSPSEWTQQRKSALAPVAYTGMRVEAGLLAGDPPGDTHVAMWLAKNGIVIGTSDGSLREVHAKRIRLPDNQAAGVGAAVIHDRQVLATIN